MFAIARLRGPAWHAVRYRPSYTRCASSHPHVFQLSFWQSLVPSFARSSNGILAKAWNSATFYILASLVIGSNAVNMVIMTRDFETAKRQSIARMDTLRDVLEALQQGKDVDVRNALGTGDPPQEQEWKRALERAEVSRPPARKPAKDKASDESERRPDPPLIDGTEQSKLPWSTVRFY